MVTRGRAAALAEDRALQNYNSLVLQNQDEAFGLAFDLLGTEDAACRLVEQVFVNGFAQQKDTLIPFRLRVLRQVVRACLKGSRRLPGLECFGPHLARLSNPEKVALVLVERLGLSCAEAAVVMQQPGADFRGMLMKARFSSKRA